MSENICRRATSALVTLQIRRENDNLLSTAHNQNTILKEKELFK